MSSTITLSKQNWLLVLVWALLPLYLFPQNSNDLRAKLVDNFQALSKQKQIDLVYIQSSKGIYETEEDLWFKCYVLNSQTYTLSLQSKTLFVQLINDKTQKAVWEEKYEIKNGFVDGHLYLKDSLQAGNYTMQAYSSHSFYENSQEFYAARKLKIVKKIAQKKEIIRATKDSVVHFSSYPEGGNLVSGIQNTLAFKAVNSRGKPVAISGTLFENNKPLLEFKSVHAGMGRVVFIPDIDKSYHIQLSDSLKKTNYKLPEIFRQGISMKLTENNKDFLLFNISQSKTLIQTPVYLRLQVRGEVYSLAQAKLKNQVKVKIPLKDVPQGIAEVTLFNANFEPICERLVYIKQDEQLHIKTILNKSEYKTREKATLKIQVTDASKQPVIAHLGLSIYDRIYKNPRDSKNILTHFNLTTQLKGELQNPGYYFDKKNQNRKEALNLLLLTQGWRRYLWNETNLEEQKTRNQVVFDDINGKIVSPKKYEKKLQELTPVLMVYNPQKKGQEEFVLIDSTKMFTITPKHLNMGNHVYLKLMVPQKPKYTVDINDYAFNSINTIRKTKKIKYPLPFTNSIEIEEMETFKGRSDVKVLEEVMVKAKQRKVYRDKYLGQLDSIARLEMITDYVCEVSDILNCPNHPRSKKSKVPIEGKTYLELMVWTENGYVKGIPTNGRPFKNPPLPPYKYPVLTEEYLMSRFNLTRIKGYYGKREFYQPIYDKDTIEDAFPDYRNTLYWNPSIITDEKGEATIEFFCSDINTKFIGNIEGIGGQGLLGIGSFELVVRKTVD